MFFARLVVFLFDRIPEGLMRMKVMRELYFQFDYFGCKQKVITWHHAELEKLDVVYAMQQRGLRVIAAREKARAEGIGPDDPRYPDVIDWKEELKVHAEVLARYRESGGERMKRLEAALDLKSDRYPQERVDAVTKACVNALKQKDR